MPTASRREARERALALLYEAEAKGQTVDEVLADLPLEPDAYAVDLVQGVAKHQEELDSYISRLAKDWRLDRMPVVDRTLLRMGIYELLHRPDVPTGAAIAEAVELASQYSTDESGRFVNGVLSAVAREVRPTG